ncbi:MAG: sulfatase-like hydrolase/transferase, partial [Bryobacter sp.]|nr:sulfatase-like hydrolase/transferase [Bryobacter sp.]
MNRRNFMAQLAAAAAPRPNVLIYITDDESWLERSAYGWSKLPTPHFDRVAREGVLFTHAYTSAPSCAPSRAALLTGRNFWELEEGAFIQAWLPEKFPRLPDLMEAGGYAAGFTGKGWGPGVLPPNAARKRNPAGEAFNRIRNTVREEAMSGIDYAANLADFLDRRPSGKPFCFWAGSTEPHDPHAPTNHQRLREYGFGMEAVRIPEYLPDNEENRRKRGDFAYEIRHADEDLGKILKVLEVRRELDNTIVIVTADNGTAIPRSKTNVYDWGVRVPLAIRWPKAIAA